MNYIDFDPNLSREHNQQIRREVDSLRLEERLLEDRESSDSRLGALARRGALPPLRAVRLVG